ncbi:MAG: MmgE/PrpD family protein [Firmicutes bacterium]|nr:MmgE/PrpD family protein [Bacillota bacterium]
MMKNGLTRVLAEHAVSVRFEDLPKEAVEAQKASAADMLGVMLAATGLDKASKAFSELAAREGAGRCTILGRQEKSGPIMAALANGALVHALDYEDSHETATVHPNSAAFPALMALSQHIGGVSGRDFITAMAVASDICCRLDLGANEDLLKYGWNMPPICGSLGAVMGAGRLLGLDEERMMDAIALDLNQVTSSGEAANSRGSAMRTVREGFAAQAAVQSALLASIGVPAAFEQAFEGKLGYYHMYARDDYDPGRVTEGLGKIFQSAFISFKPWPACRATHTSIEGVLRIMNEQGLKAEDIQSIEITLQEIGRMVTEPGDVKYRPDSAAIAKFSLPFVVATAVRFGGVDLGSFSEERLRDSDTLAMCDKVSCRIEQSWTKAQNKFTDLRMVTAKGTFELHLEHPLGCLENPMTSEDRLRKFRECASFSAKKYSEAQIAEILDTIDRLEDLDDMSRLFGLL